MNTKKTMTYDIGNPGFGLGHAQKFGMVKRSLGFNSPLLITGSPPAIHTVKPVYNGHLGENDKMTTIYR